MRIEQTELTAMNEILRAHGKFDVAQGSFSVYSEVAVKNAPVANISGPVDNPDANTLEVLLRLLQNAFVKAILPGFDRDVRRPGR